MKNTTLLVLSALSLAVFPVTSQGQEINTYFETLNNYNHIQPLQNPLWQRSTDILKDNITDSKNKVLGEVEDVLIGSNGAIEYVQADLDRMRIGSQVPLNYSQLAMSATSRGYAIGFDENQIEELYPQLLANIDTAAGGEMGLISVSQLVGSDVRTANNQKIGKVEEVMFSQTGTSVEALVIRVRYRSVGGESVAIPFSDAVYMPDGSRYTVLLDEEKVGSIVSYARAND